MHTNKKNFSYLFYIYIYTINFFFPFVAPLGGLPTQTQGLVGLTPGPTLTARRPRRKTKCIFNIFFFGDVNILYNQAF